VKPGRAEPTWREAVLLYAVVLVAFFVGTWAVDRLSGAPFDPAHAAIMGLCLVAGWWSCRRISQVVARRRR
jgi:positive regulator of sigma E activity